MPLPARAAPGPTARAGRRSARQEALRSGDSPLRIVPAAVAEMKSRAECERQRATRDVPRARAPRRCRRHAAGARRHWPRTPGSPRGGRTPRAPAASSHVPRGARRRRPHGRGSSLRRRRRAGHALSLPGGGRTAARDRCPVASRAPGLRREHRLGPTGAEGRPHERDRGTGACAGPRPREATARQRSASARRPSARAGGLQPRQPADRLRAPRRRGRQAIPARPPTGRGCTRPALPYRRFARSPPSFRQRMHGAARRSSRRRARASRRRCDGAPRGAPLLREELLLEAVPQQVVVAEPLAATVEGDEKDADRNERVERRRRDGRVERRVAERSAHPVENRRPPQERPLFRLECCQAFLADELEELVVARAEAPAPCAAVREHRGGFVDSGRPALGLLHQGRQVGVAERDARRPEGRGRFASAQRQVGGADLVQSAGGA